MADGALRAALLTLVDGTDRWPWWGTSDIGGLRTEMGAPLVGLTVPARGWPRAPAVQPRRRTLTPVVAAAGRRRAGARRVAGDAGRGPAGRRA